MTDSSWYRVERILSEKNEQKGARVVKYYEVLWAPTWEPASRIKAQVPLIVEEFEKQKRKKASGAKSSGPESAPRSSKQIRILGVTRDNGRNIENSTLLVQNLHSGEQWRMQYEDVKKDYQAELIEFFEECVCGFTD